VLFQKRFWAGIQDGTITMTFRRWKRPQAVPGRRRRTPAGIIEVESVHVVTAGEISDAEARRAGHPDAQTLIAELPGEDGQPIYRITFRHVAEPDPRDLLANDADLAARDVGEIDAKLDRLDARSSHGPWTAATLAIIADRPEVRAGDLAEALGRERKPFKLDVRKLKNLGLTLSFRVGYRLSPRGEAYLGRTGRGRPAP
jgi:hypothetical protein